MQNNYAPTNSNTKVTKIKRTPQDGIDYKNNISKNLNKNFYSLGTNKYHPLNNSLNTDLNKTSPNLRTINYKTKVKKLPNKRIEDKLNNNYILKII